MEILPKNCDSDFRIFGIKFFIQLSVRRKIDYFFLMSKSRLSFKVQKGSLKKIRENCNLKKPDEIYLILRLPNELFPILPGHRSV